MLTTQFILATTRKLRYWKIDGWTLSDVSKLIVRLKNEFNASKENLMDGHSRIIASRMSSLI